MKPCASYKPSGVAWLGDVPAHWRIEKVKFQARLRGDKAVGANGVRYVGMEHVLPKVGKFNPMVEGTQEEAESTVNVFFKGDVLFGKLRPYLAKCVVADTDGVCSSEFLVLSPSDEVVPAYLNATMLMQEFIDAVDASTYGAKMPRADWGFIGQQRLPLPPPDEQQAIADYLDTETARIDTLVQEKEELIGLLKEARSATITEAVSRGLCPSVPLKSSGLHFLGNVPKHWKKFKVAHAFGTSSGTTPPTDEPKWYEGDVPWVQSSELRENVVFSTEKKVTVEAVQKFSALKIYPAGTLLLAMYGATIGRVGLLGVPATTNQACCALHPLGEISTQFFCWWLQAYRDELVARGYGGGQPNISATLISGMYFFAPLPEEQQAIAEYLDDETAKIDALITHTQEEIALLKELRAATIADAVLGRVDVRTTVTKGVRRAENEL